MEKVVPNLFFIALFMFIPLLGHCSSIEENREFDQWFQKLDNSKPKLTRFHFYFHDIVSGYGQTSFVVVPPPKIIKPSTTLFGQVNMFDNPLTKGPELTSELVGRAQGLYSFASQEELCLLMAMTIVFTSGKHNGSGVTILGRNAVFQSRREFPIVGGTGDFRLGRGFASVSSYFVNATLGILEYNLMVIQY
ncbi:dirigent protein 22-like [Rosa rugosa]|uniref:dirigent protein 22-like n=1 Tax=Rosa rugosa TaxID=74645 RepID=UPI002B414AB0|nr:dirigent protein 22-like [Rosa rugosa]